MSCQFMVQNPILANMRESVFFFGTQLANNLVNTEEPVVYKVLFLNLKRFEDFCFWKKQTLLKVLSEVLGEEKVAQKENNLGCMSS